MDIVTRRKLAELLIAEAQRTGESVKDSIPEGEHISIAWWPDGHTDVIIGGVNGITLSAFSCGHGSVTVL